MTIDQTTIDARNCLNRKADQLESDLLELMAGFHNQKVWKISGWGGMTAKLAKAVKSLEDQHGFSETRTEAKLVGNRFTLIIRSEVTSVWAELKYRYDRYPDGVCNYCSESFRIGRRDDSGVLTELESGLTYPEGRKQYKLAEVQSAITEARKLEDQAQALRSSVSVFNRIR